MPIKSKSIPKPTSKINIKNVVSFFADRITYYDKYKLLNLVKINNK